LCKQKYDFLLHKCEGREEQVYLDESKTTLILGKGKILLNLIYGKTLTLSDVLSITVNLICVALLENVGVEESFEYDKIVMKNNNVFMGETIL